ncbi:MAG: sporulation transcription factor Spo0A [Oscillospiraceae bacterium]
MSGVRKVLIGDNSMQYGIPCADILISMDFEVSIVPKDGAQMIEAIEKKEPDIVIMDAFMPQLDAIGVMGRIKQLECKQPIFIITCNYDNPFVEKSVMENGAAYYMLRPFDPEYLCHRINSMSLDGDGTFHLMSEAKKDPNETDLEVLVTDVILQIGVPAHVKGYYYLREGIILAINDTEMIDSVTKQLYPAIAKTFDTTSSRVERAIRHSIEIAWDRGDVDTLNSYFGYTIHTGRGKPTNSEFIAMIADKLRLKIKKMKIAI